jgi:hypothetical protein
MILKLFDVLRSNWCVGFCELAEWEILKLQFMA